MANLTLSKVSKHFDQSAVVSDVDIDIRDGEFMVFVGPSGCGKSTTLRMIAGLETPTSGTIRIGDRVVNDVHPADRDVAMVFQSYALYPHMSVYDNMAYGLRRRGLGKAEIKRRVEDTAAMLRLEELLGRRPSQLSGGQRQRVALGRAIVRKPDVFLMDEPLSNLDAKLRVQMRGELGRLHAALKVTTIYVTHDQVEAMTMGDRIVVMNGGRVEQIGSPLDLYQRPASLFVAQFLGLPEINLLRGRVERAGAGRRFDGDGVSLQLPAETESQGDVVLGLRPQTVIGTRPGEAVGARQVLGEAAVTAVEHHGPESYVSCDLGHLSLTASVAPASNLSIGSRVVISSDVDEPHLFTADTGRRI